MKRSYVLVLLAMVVGAVGVSAATSLNMSVNNSVTTVGAHVMYGTNIQKEAQEPSYVASTKAPQIAGGETQEAKALANYAKITPKDAENAALAKVPGKVVKVSLDDENGYVVYSVEISTNSGIKDIKIDAGNGQVLHIDSGVDHETGDACKVLEKGETVEPENE